jgi:L-alanine-DL-glutamate epimerase-like enolase superfamily enzyme
MSHRIDLSYARYRTLYHHPFGTAHGLRDGTDAVFIRATRNGIHGYGEASLPPYVSETQDSVIESIQLLGNQIFWNDRLDQYEKAAKEFPWTGRPAARAALTTALLDLRSKEEDRRPAEILGTNDLGGRPATMFTLGHCRPGLVAQRLEELPAGDILKVKLGSSDDRAFLSAVVRHSAKPLFLDGNQGIGSLEELMSLLALVEPGRVVGVEEPFGSDRSGAYLELKRCTDIPMYADESVQGLDDLDALAERVQGVNVKLMKCGGLDQAARMIERARQLGLLVMQGSMSETTLGCAAALQLGAQADLLDLDGPWLLGNDPFKGMVLEQGTLMTTGPAGFGVELVADLDWVRIGA